MGHDRLGEGTHADRHRDEIRSPAELCVDLREERVVALDDPGGRLLVALPRGVLDQLSSRTLASVLRG